MLLTTSTVLHPPLNRGPSEPSLWWGKGGAAPLLCLKKVETWRDPLASGTQTQSLCPESSCALSLGPFPELSASALGRSWQVLPSLTSLPLPGGSSFHEEVPVSLGFEEQQPLLQFSPGLPFGGGLGVDSPWVPTETAVTYRS